MPPHLGPAPKAGHQFLDACQNEGITPITGNRAVIFRGREPTPGAYEYGPLEVLDLSTGEFTVLAGCWMEEQAARDHEPCPDGASHPAGALANPGSKAGTEFMILNASPSEEGTIEVFVSIWDSSTLTEMSRFPAGDAEPLGDFLEQSVLTDEHLVLISSETGIVRVLDRVTLEVLFEDAASRPSRIEHDRAQNRIWMTNNFDTEVWVLDLDAFEYRPVTGHVADIVRGLATSPSGALVAVTSGDGFVRIYTDEGDLRHSIPLPNPSDAWWLDEENLVVGTGNGPWTVLTIDSDRLLATVKASLSRGFTDAECSLYEIDPCPTLEELQGG